MRKPILLTLLLTLLAAAPAARADVITDWDEKAAAFVTPLFQTQAAQRAIAMVDLAMFDAVNAIERRYRPYIPQDPAPALASKEAAAAAAAGTVLASFAPADSKAGAEIRQGLISPRFPTARPSRPA